MNLDAIGVIHAVEYEIDGKLSTWVVDGQHRCRALVEVGFGEWVVDVKIHLDVKDHAGACKLFLGLNKRASVRPYPTFLNEVIAGFPAATGVGKLLEDRGITISDGYGDGKACCVVTLKRVFAEDDGEILGLTVDTALAAWGSAGTSLEGKILEGLSMVYRKYNGMVDQAGLVKKFSMDYHWVMMEVSGGKARGTVYNDKGETIDQFSIKRKKKAD